MSSAAAATTRTTQGQSRKIIIEFPELLLEKAEAAANEESTDRSKLIRAAVESYLAQREQLKIADELAEAYQVNGDLALALCGEFTHVDGESF